MKITLPKQLPEIDIDKIRSLKGAKQQISKLLNLVEELLQQNVQILKENQILKDEIARLKGYSPKPKFKPKTGNSNKGDHSVSKHLKKMKKKLGMLKKKSWTKSSKKGKIEIDKVVNLPEVDICECGSSDLKVIRTKKRIVQGVIIRRNNTLYQGRDKQCLSCGKIHKAPLPEEIKGVEFDAETRSWISYWKYACRRSEPLIHNFLSGLGMIISVGQISNIAIKNGKKLNPSYTHLKVWGIKTSPYLQSDATGSKRKSKRSGKICNQHLHFLGHKLLSIFTITRKYNSSTMNKILTKRGRRLLFTSDDHGANGKKLLIEKKQLCWWHEIEHYLKLLPHLLVHKRKLKSVTSQIWDFYRKAKEYGYNYVRDPTKEGRVKDKQELEELFERIFSQKTGYDQLDRRLSLTMKKKDRLLLFLDYPYIPIHNNQAERDLRHAVILRRLSGGTKSEEGDRSLERHLSIIQTAEKQGLDVFQTLHGLLTNQLHPSILTAKTLSFD
jgi:hypothetical protein